MFQCFKCDMKHVCSKMLCVATIIVSHNTGYLQK